MKELEVVKFIKSNKDWVEKLSKAPYCIEIKADNDYILLKYRLTDNPDFSLRIVQECRGLILRKVDFKPVCIPFFKFGNYGESYVPKIDWESAVIQEKIDGSLIKLWYDNNDWHISTNGTINAYEAEIGTGIEYSNFGDLFMAAFVKTNVEFCNLNKDCTYMFELVSPFNMQVVNYENIDIYHIGTRNNLTLEENNDYIGIQKPTVYEIGKTLQEVIEQANKFGIEKEGFVVVDKFWNRIKIKSEDYVKAHYLNNGNNISDKKILEVILSGEEQEFLNYVPKYEERLNEIKAKLDMLISSMDAEFKELKKNIAMIINGDRKYLHKAYLFSRVSKNLPAIEFLKNMSVDNVYKLILKG